jgi:hypothetical protein
VIIAVVAAGAVIVVFDVVSLLAEVSVVTILPSQLVLSVDVAPSSQSSSVI